MTNFPSLLARTATTCIFFFAACVGAAEPPSSGGTDRIAPFLKDVQFETLKISPNGDYFAITVPVGDKIVLVTIRRSDMKQVGLYNVAGKTRINNFWWVSDNRIVFSIAEKSGYLDTPAPTGELFGMNVDGTQGTILAGWRSAEQQVGTFIRKRDGAPVWADMVDTLDDNDRQVLIATTLVDVKEPEFTEIDRLDVFSGLRYAQSRVPIPFAEILADRHGVARFAAGRNRAGAYQMFYRSGANADWTLVNDELKDGHREVALAFSANDDTVYLEAEQSGAPDAIYSMNLASGERQLVVQDKRVDPDSFLFAHDGRTLAAAVYRDPKPRLFYLDDALPEARTMKVLIDAFPGKDVEVTGWTRDGSLALTLVTGDRDPGSYYLFDRRTNAASFLIARADWLRPEQLAEMRSIEFTARDGTPLQALLTLPASTNGPLPPLVVNPHGGPYAVADLWRYAMEPQLLAAQGFAVLQVNFRGSGNYGRDFQLAGYGQWGRLMQDDLADATRAVIAQKMIDPQRICLYGASYGAYAALMGVVREPSLYRCAVGYAGVYDLNLMSQVGDIRETESGRNDLANFLGTDSGELARRSPVNHAEEIKVPVFLATAGKDERAPQKHSEEMRDALKRAGNPPEWLEYKTEGHGYFAPEHRQAFYQQLVAFLHAHLDAASNASDGP